MTDNEKGNETATEAQLNDLVKWGVRVPPRPTAKEAARMLAELADRKARGLCSYNQAAWLAKQGLTTEVTAEEARTILDATQANGWRVPADIRAKYGKPN